MFADWLGKVRTVAVVAVACAATVAGSSREALSKPKAASADGAPSATGSPAGKKDPKRAYVGRSPTPGVIKVHRLATNEEFSLRVGPRGKVSADTAKKFAQMMRATTGGTHHMDPRLISLLAQVSDHFGGRKIEVISGFRPYTPKQYTKDSRHNHGRAVDFRVVGVPNTVLRDYCRTLKNTGCGYYPNSVFVHMDTRDTSAYWIDYSRPGEAPRYHAPNSDADEGTSDVHADHDDKDGKDAADKPQAPASVTPTPGEAPSP
jgi:uncharacterized protein YcbK (DUF882 family)